MRLARTWVRTRWARVRAAAIGGRDAGMTTAEYAIGTVAAAAFAGLLLRILTSPAVEHVLANAFNRAFSYLYQ